MSADRSLEREVTAAFLEAAPSREPDRLYDSIVTTTSRVRPRPRWLAMLKEPPMRYRSHVAFGSPTARLAALALATLLLSVLGAGALVAGAQSPSPAPPENAAVSPPVEVTGEIVCGPEVRTGTDEWIPDAAGNSAGLYRSRGDAWRQTATMSDPRLTGTYYTSEDHDEYRVAGASGISIASYTRRIENDDGAWQGSDTYAYLSDGSLTAISTVLVGEGAYEGLRVIWEELWEDSPACTGKVRGVIIEGEPPAVPEPYTSG